MVVIAGAARSQLRNTPEAFVRSVTQMCGGKPDVLSSSCRICLDTVSARSQPLYMAQAFTFDIRQSLRRQTNASLECASVLRLRARPKEGEKPMATPSRGTRGQNWAKRPPPEPPRYY